MVIISRESAYGKKEVCGMENYVYIYFFITLFLSAKWSSQWFLDN